MSEKITKDKKSVIGTWGFYEEQYYNDKIFVTPDAAIGENLLKPMNDLYRVGKANNVEFVSLDLLSDQDEADSYIFFDFPRMDSPYVKAAFETNKPKALFILESPLIKPENWSASNHELFSKIFTYRDDIVDDLKFFKINYSFDLPKNIEKNIKSKEKLCVVIAGSKMLHHELSLYPARIEAIRWFEKNHPGDFDLYGMGWDARQFPSYKGTVKSKKQTLQKYKFSICYENTRDIPGYVTEKIFDCLFSGCVPVYWGADNITSYIPKNCFIDRREFGDYEDLYDFMLNMDDETYLSYINAAEEFLNSAEAYKFTITHFVETVLKECADIGDQVLFEKSSDEIPMSSGKRPYEDLQCPTTENIEIDKCKGLASIIVSSFGKLEYTKQCIESILRYTKTHYELMLFDNGSSDGTFEYFESIKKLHPETVVLRNRKNRVVEENGNHAHSMARGEYIVCLSNDNIVHEGWLENFIRQIESAPDIGMVGPRSNNISGPQMVKADYTTIDGYHEFAAGWCREHAGTSFEVGRMVGMALIIKKTTLERIGGSDPFLATNGRDGGYGFSDDDLSLRLRIAGYRLVVANDVFIHHFGSVTAKDNRPDLFGKPQNLNQAKYEQKLRSNPRIRIADQGEVSFLPYKLDEPVIVPEKMKIAFPRIFIALIGDSDHSERLSRYCELQKFYPVEISSIKRDSAIALLRELSSKRRAEIAILIDDGFDVSFEDLKKLIEHTLYNPEVAVMVPLGAYAPSTHSIEVKSNDEVDLIPYADMSVCALNVKHFNGSLSWNEKDCDDSLWFLQRRVRGEGYYIGRANEIKIESGLHRDSHPYDKNVLPESLFEKRDLEGAAAIYRDDVRRDPMFFDSIYQLGRVAFEQKSYRHAVIDFSRVLEIDPHHVESLVYIAKISLEEGDLAQAERAARLAFFKQPRNPEVKKIVEQYEMASAKKSQAVPELKPEKKGLTSIILTGSKYLDDIKKCVESVRKLTPEQHEIIFVDHGFTERTNQWLSDLIKNNPQYSVVKSGDAGLGSSFNAGIAASSGEYILLLDNRVTVAANWLGNMLKCVSSTNDTGIVGPAANGPSNKEAGQDSANYKYHRVKTAGLEPHCMLFRRSVLNSTGLFDQEFKSGRYAAEDFCLRARLEGFMNYIAADVFVKHTAIKDSATEIKEKEAYFGKWSGLDLQTDQGRKLLALKALDKADLFIQQADINKAIDVIFEGLKFAPQDKRLYYQLAEILIEAKRFKDAEDVIDQMPGNSDDVKGLVLKGYCKDGLDLHDEAAELADKVLKYDEKSAAALNLKGLCTFKKGDVQGALEFFRHALETDPGYGEPYTNLGVIAWAQGNHSEGLDLLEKGFILSPLKGDISDEYYAAVIQNNAFDRAGKILADTVKLYPASRTIAFLFIDCLVRQDKNEQAMSEIERSILAFGIDDGMLSAALSVRDKIGPKEIEPKKGSSTISLSMIVKNEEANIAKCLHSVEGLVDEMIVVDTGSADRTIDIAKAFGAKIFDIEWKNDFSAARNYSISKASGDWILVLDGDEVVSEKDFTELKRLADKNKTGFAYSFATRNYVERSNVEGWIKNDGVYTEEAGIGWLPSFKIRLFPKDENIRFANPVHETVEASVNKIGKKILSCNVPIHHYGKLAGAELNRAKGEEYYLLGLKKLGERGEDLTALVELAIQAAELDRYDEAAGLWLRAIKLKPDYAKAHFNLGCAYLKLGKFAEGSESSRKALDLDSNLKEAVLNYSNCELYQGNPQNALAELEKMLSKYPGHPSATALLGITYVINGMEDKGVGCFDKLRRMNADSSSAIFSHAKEFRRAGRTDFALRLLETAVKHGYANLDIIKFLEELKGL